MKHVLFIPHAVLVLTLLLPRLTGAAILDIEDFEGGAAGWTDREVGGMTVSHEAAVGSPASGAMQGLFGASFLPQTDAFTLSSGGSFLGTYAGLTGFTFDLFAQDVLPSDAALRLISGGDTFFIPLNLGSMTIGFWNPFTVSLTYGSGWQGGASAFNTMLQVSGVDQVELQITTGGSGAQSFFFDNFGTTGDDLGGGGDPVSAVPEPSSVSTMLLLGCLALLARRGQLAAAMKGVRS
mgnify:CR=1 FL=1